jgi:hypothetical protein
MLLDTTETKYLALKRAIKPHMTIINLNNI